MYLKGFFFFFSFNKLVSRSVLKRQNQIYKVWTFIWEGERGVVVVLKHPTYNFNKVVACKSFHRPNEAKTSQQISKRFPQH